MWEPWENLLTTLKQPPKTQEKIHVKQKPYGYTRTLIVSYALFIEKEEEEVEKEKGGGEKGGRRKRASEKKRKLRILLYINAKWVVEYVLRQIFMA